MSQGIYWRTICSEKHNGNELCPTIGNTWSKLNNNLLVGYMVFCLWRVYNGIRGMVCYNCKFKKQNMYLSLNITLRKIIYNTKRIKP